MNKAEIPVAQRAVLSMLLDDHREVKKLFKTFQQEKDEAAREQIVRDACEKLTVHTQLEEEVFYPYVRDNGGEAFKDLVDEAVVEHATAKDLIQQLNGMHAGDEEVADGGLHDVCPVSGGRVRLGSVNSVSSPSRPAALPCARP